MSNCRLLIDSELKDFVHTSPPLVEGYPDQFDALTADSPIQPCSVDLHVGEIFLPGTKLGQEGSEGRPLAVHSLGPGETVLIVTKEKLNLPPHIAAIGFPPSRISEQGVLMTNPGHVDPGYSGPMRFAVVNMGRKTYSVRRGDMIVTVLLFELGTSVAADWKLRTHGRTSATVKQENVEVLSKDFLDVSQRAESIADSRLKQTGLDLEKLKVNVEWHTKWAIIIATAVATVLTAAATWSMNWLSGINDLKTRVTRVEERGSMGDLSDRIRKLEQELKRLEAATRDHQQATAGAGKDAQ